MFSWYSDKPTLKISNSVIKDINNGEAEMFCYVQAN
jgi:hypothetical protein